MDLMQKIFEKAKEKKKKIVFPESTDERILAAVKKIIDQGLANVILVGNPEKIKVVSGNLNLGLDIDKIEIHNPSGSGYSEKFAEKFFARRSHKGVTMEQAKETVIEPIYFASLLVEEGVADAMVAGATHPTADILRAGIFCIGLQEGIKTVSSFFIMMVPDCIYGEDGIFIFADAGVIPEPTVEQLADIAIASSESFKDIIGAKPKVAMLSFSTKGSAQYDLATKVINATELVKKVKPDLDIDGELQADAALVPEVGIRKAPGSKVAGKANVLVFPDLNAANISYKLVQRLAKATALGPVLQGLKKPVSDLSRGCSADDIVGIAAITATRVK